MVCHLENGLEGHVHRADRYIIVTRPMIFVVVRVSEQLACQALFARWIGAIDPWPGFKSEVQL